MPHKAPGKYYRKGLSWLDITKMFPNEETAEQWFAQTRWPNGPICPECQSTNVQSGAKHKTMPYRCRSCRVRFSVKTGTVMQGSKLDLQVWAIAIYILTTGLKGTSSMKTSSGFEDHAKDRVVFGPSDSGKRGTTSNPCKVWLKWMRPLLVGKKPIGTPRKRVSRAGGLLGNMPWLA